MTRPTSKGFGAAAPPPSDSQQQLIPATREEELHVRGLVRANIVVPIDHNERQKKLARKVGRKTDEFMGEHYMKLFKASQNEEALPEAKRLRDQFGDDWLEILRQAER